MDRYIETHSTREIIEKAEAILGENIELNRQVNELRGRLKELRRENAICHNQLHAFQRYKAYDARRRQILMAAVGLTVAATLMLVALAMSWGWARG